MTRPLSTAPPPGCPDWLHLAAARDAGPGDPPGWDEALRHLDGCPRCQRTAPGADPLLVFRRLPAPPLAADEAEAMRLRLAALRGATRVGARGTSRYARPLRLAAAAAIVALAVLAGGNLPQHTPPAATAAIRPSLAAASRPDAALAAEPVLEGLDRPYDHVVQWNGDDLSVVLVVDGRLGV